MSDMTTLDTTPLDYFNNIESKEINGRQHFVLAEDGLSTFKEGMNEHDELRI